MTYLNAASCGILPEPSRKVLNEIMAAHASQGTVGLWPFYPKVGEARRSVARFIGASPDEIAFVSNTTQGLQTIAENLRWNSGDEIILCEGDFPGHLRVWKSLERLGVRMKYLPYLSGRYELEGLKALITDETKLIAVSEVHFISGFRWDLRRLSEFAHGLGLLVCVDAIQALGVCPHNIQETGVDFMVAGGQKWLCGPLGTGILFCKQAHIPRLSNLAGWRSFEHYGRFLTDGEGFLEDPGDLKSCAEKFEYGSLNLPGILALGESVKVLSELNVDTIFKHVTSMGAFLAHELLKKGYEVLEPWLGGEGQSGIVSFRTRDGTSPELFKRLTSSGFALSFPDGKIRVSPHYYNQPLHLEELLHAL